MTQFRNIRSCKLDIGFSISIRYFCFLKLPYGIIRKTIGTLHIRKLQNSFRGSQVPAQLHRDTAYHFQINNDSDDTSACCKEQYFLCCQKKQIAVGSWSNPSLIRLNPKRLNLRIILSSYCCTYQSQSILPVGRYLRRDNWGQISRTFYRQIHLLIGHRNKQRMQLIYRHFRYRF